MPDERGGQDQQQDVVVMLNELRVLLPGVQVLFAFLLTVPFSQRFGQLSRVDRAVYFAALLLAAGSSVLLIAPSIHARLSWRDHDSEWLLRLSDPFAVAGSALLGAGIACAVYLIADVLYRASVAGIVGAIVVPLVLAAWYAPPLIHRRRRS
jgi:predicted neutral ceramidase superfamily lipid hydrolase